MLLMRFSGDLGKVDFFRFFRGFDLQTRKIWWVPPPRNVWEDSFGARKTVFGAFLRLNTPYPCFLCDFRVIWETSFVSGF